MVLSTKKPSWPIIRITYACSQVRYKGPLQASQLLSSLIYSAAILPEIWAESLTLHRSGASSCVQAFWAWAGSEALLPVASVVAVARTETALRLCSLCEVLCAGRIAAFTRCCLQSSNTLRP